MPRKRGNTNIFKQSKQIQETGRLSDMDYLDNFEQLDEPEPKEEKKEAVESRPAAKKPTKKPPKQKWTRTTFIVSPESLEDLKDIVHTVKSTGNYQYSQKQALHEAIKLLKAKVGKEVGKIDKAPTN